MQRMNLLYSAAPPYGCRVGHKASRKPDHISCRPRSFIVSSACRYIRRILDSVSRTEAIMSAWIHSIVCMHDCKTDRQETHTQIGHSLEPPYPWNRNRSSNRDAPRDRISIIYSSWLRCMGVRGYSQHGAVHDLCLLSRACKRG
jgi:hypothetical protein